MADLTISVDIDAKGTKRGAAEAKSAMKEVGDETEKAGRKVSNVANKDMKDLERSLRAATVQGQLIGQAIGKAFDIIVQAGRQAVEIIDRVTRSFAQAGIEVSKAQKITGLSAESLSALAMQARRTGISFDQVGESFKNFTKTIVDANNGQNEAIARLARLGIDAKKAANNIDSAYRQVLERIVSLKNPTDRAAAAFDAFGEQGYKLIPFLTSFNGNIDELIKKARELGVAMGEDDVRAAEEFDRAMKDFDETARGVAMMFGRELLPVVRDWFTQSQQWFQRNRETIAAWASSAANAVRGFLTALNELVAWMQANPTLTRFIIGAATFGTSEIAMSQFRMFEGFGAGNRPVLPNYDPSLNPNIPMSPASSYPRTPARAARGRAARTSRPQVPDDVKQREELLKMVRDLNIEIQFFGNNTEEAAMKQQLLKRGLFETNIDVANQLVALAAQKDRLKESADAAEKAAKVAAELKEAYNDFNIEIRNGAVDQRVQLGEVFRIQQQQLELGRDLTAVEEQQQVNITEIYQKTLEWQRAGMTNKQVQELQAKLLEEQAATLKLIAGIEDRRTQINANRLAKDLQAGLKETLEALNYEYANGSEVTERYRVEKLLLTEAYKALTPEQRAAALAVADEIDAMRQAIKAQAEMQRQYDKFYGVIRDSLQTLADEGFGGLFRKVKQMFRQFLLDMAAQWISSKFFKMFYQGGNAQAAGAGQQGGGLGGIFQSIFGSGGMGPGGTPVFNGGNNFVSGLGGGGMLPVDAQGNVIVNGNQRGGLGGFLGGLGFQRNIFTGKPLSSGMQMASGIGALVAMAGSFIPGRIGNTISMAGMGLSIGAMFGPVGAVVGAGIGALIGLFTGGGAKKRDQKEKMPQLEQGFRDALQQLRDLVRDVRTLRVDPASAIGRATELRAQIASGFGIQFESGKYRRLAQSQITQRLAEADALIAELRSAAEVSRAAMERQRRLLPEFAGGVYLSPAFRRLNGMIPGIWTGRDTVPAMLARGEMVLNPAQQLRVQQQAGFDVFKNAGIPGYAQGGMVQTAQPANEPIHVEVSVSQDASGMLRVAANSPQGRRVMLDVVSDGFRNDEVKMRRR